MMFKGKFVFPLFASFLILTAFASVSAAKTIYVPDDYEKIQWAVDNASAGDTIIVKDGTYHENVNVNKPHLTIRSENGANTTIVRAANSDDHVFEVTADYVNISGFTVKGAIGWESAGIFITANYCNISYNNILNNSGSIYLKHSSNNAIVNCNVFSNDDGISLWNSSGNVISSNKIFSLEVGIYFYESDNNIVENNKIFDNSFAIDIDFSNNNKIINNNISNNWCAISFDLEAINNLLMNNNILSNSYVLTSANSADNNKIYFNNFVNNEISYDYYGTNTWNSTEKITYTYNGNTYTNYLGNYWDDYTGSDADGDGIGDTPYSIDGDKDNYPLMERFENYFVLPPQYGVCVCVPSCAPKIIQAFPGSNISFVLKVKNTGTVEDTVLLSVTDELGWDFEYPEKIELAPGEEKYFFLNFTPPDYAYNKNEIYVKAVSASDKSKVSMCSVRYHPISYYKINCPLLFEFLFETEEELEVEEVSEFVKVSEFSPTPAGQLVLSIFVEPVGGRVENIIKVKSKETGESVAIPFTTVNHTAITTDFKFPDDSYSFENWGTFITIPILDWELGIRGRCFGMSETCLLFYEGIYELPEGRHCLHEVQKDDKTTLYNIPVSTLITIHQIRLKNTLTDWLKEFAKTDNKAEYMNLKRNISRNEPVILVMLGGKSSKGKEKALHTCVAYGIIEVSNKAYILMYDNNIPYKNDAIHFSLSYACAVLDKEKWSFKYSGYSKMMVVKATPLLKAELEQALSEGNISTLPRRNISNITIQRE